MKEYKGYFYWEEKGRWWIKFPSGFKSVLEGANDENDVKLRIDFLDNLGMSK
jgi:hypothetical protein